MSTRTIETVTAEREVVTKKRAELKLIDVSTMDETALKEHKEIVDQVEAKWKALGKESTALKKAKEPTEDKVEAYKVPKNEKHLYHLRVCRRGFSQETGKRLHKPHVHICIDKEYPLFKKYNKELEILEVLNDPTK